MKKIGRENRGKMASNKTLLIESNKENWEEERRKREKKEKEEKCSNGKKCRGFDRIENLKIQFRTNQRCNLLRWKRKKLRKGRRRKKEIAERKSKRWKEWREMKINPDLTQITPNMTDEPESDQELEKISDKNQKIRKLENFDNTKKKVVEKNNH